MDPIRAPSVIMLAVGATLCLTTLPAAAETPACQPELRKGRIWLGDVDTGIRVTDRYDNDLDRFEDSARVLVVWPLDEVTVAVALKDPLIQNPRRDHPDGRLWRVPCDEPSASALWVDEPLADFGHAATTPDGRHLLYSSVHFGAGILELSSGARRRLLEPLTLTDVADYEYPGDDIVIGLVGDGRTLRLERGIDVSGHQGWRGTVYDVVIEPLPGAPLRPDDPRITQPRRAAQRP